MAAAGMLPLGAVLAARMTQAQREEQAPKPKAKGALKVSEESLKGLQASLPAVAGAGTAVTEHFYKKLFTNYPALKNTFNNTNQKAGKQPAALFGNVAMAATACVRDGGATIPAGVLQLINHKHCALGVVPAQYDAVGETLLATIVDLLNPGQEVVDSWGELYGQIAKLYIALEEELYAQSEAAGGWRGKRDFRVASVTQESANVRSVVFEPVEAGALPAYRPGQYLTVWVHPEGWEFGQPRHYSLSDAPSKDSFRISVKREGQVSDVIHEAKVGDVMALSAPFGSFSCDVEEVSKEADVVLLSAGIGVTPMLSMLKTLAKGDQASKAAVHWYHAARDGEEHSFRGEVEEAGKALKTFTSDVWYSAPKEGDAGKFDHEGRMDLAAHREALTGGSRGAHAYFCGPDAWMLDVRRQLADWGVPADRVHFEHFGPQPLEG